MPDIQYFRIATEPEVYHGDKPPGNQRFSYLARCTGRLHRPFLELPIFLGTLQLSY